MARHVSLTRLAAAMSLAPIAALLFLACGGSDVVDAPDAQATADASGEAATDAARDAVSPGADATDRDAAIQDAGSDAEPGADAGRDAASVDAGRDAGSLDAGRDAGQDAAGLVDAGLDATLDAGLDAGLDATLDAGLDAGLDATLDAGLDAGLDATVDAGLDATLDAGLDAEASVPLPNPLGAAADFAVLAGTAVTLTGVSPIVGDVGVSPGTSIATFSPGQPIGAVHAGDAIAGAAQGALTVLYNSLAGKPCIPANDLSNKNLGGMTLAPGTYCFLAAAELTGDLFLDAQGNPNASWTFQIGSSLLTATSASVTILNGPQSLGCNVFWQIGSSATLGTTTKMMGNLVALTSISTITGTVIVPGRALARSGAVTLGSSTVSKALCP